MIKVGNDSFRHTQFGPKASETISQRRFFFFAKISAQNSKLENNASDNTSLMRYLKNTSSRGMVINPTRELTIDAYPDATEVTSKKLCRCVWLVTSVD